MTDIHKITVETRFPDKWRFVDMESGEVWTWQYLYDRLTWGFRRAQEDYPAQSEPTERKAE